MSDISGSFANTIFTKFSAEISNFTAECAEKLTGSAQAFSAAPFLFSAGFLVSCGALDRFLYVRSGKGIKKFIASLHAERASRICSGLVDRIQFKMGRWLQGQIFLMFIIFVLDYLGLLLIGAPYALVLALIAGILEIVPYIGPIISAILATAISFLHGPVTGLLVLALFVLVQQLEGYVFTPLVMKKAVGLNPVVVILALMIGAKLAGVLGIIVAIPIATVIGEVVK